MNDRKELVLICNCSSLDHAIRFTHWDEDDIGYVHVILQYDLPFFKRLVAAFRYLFNMTCRFGSVAEVCLSREDMPKLREWIDSAEKKENTNVK